MTGLKYSFIIVLFLVSCAGEQDNQNQNNIVSNDTIQSNIDSSLIDLIEIDTIPEYIVDSLELSLIAAGLVNVQDIIPEVLIDVRYSSTNNFMEQDVYGNLNRIYLQPSVAEDIKKSYEKLISKD